MAAHRCFFSRRLLKQCKLPSNGFQCISLWPKTLTTTAAQLVTQEPDQPVTSEQKPLSATTEPINTQANETKDDGGQHPTGVIKIPDSEWKFVERLLPPDTVPKPLERESYPSPSGWLPQFADPNTMPYWVHRTKNHMMPVYLKTGLSDPTVTTISHIDGDIWRLNEDLKEYLQEGNSRKVLIQVREVTNQLKIHGNHVIKVGQFLLDKGL